MPQNALSLSRVSPISVQSLGSPRAELAKCDLAKHPVAMDYACYPHDPNKWLPTIHFFLFLIRERLLTLQPLSTLGESDIWVIRGCTS